MTGLPFFIQVGGAVLLFLLGLRLSAFFSGAETGFYRASYLRLMIDAHAGDPAARRLVWFSRNPGYFVATTLVGNNVANYLTTLAIGLLIAAVAPGDVAWAEIAGTLLLSPLIFLWGELIPKNLYYRAPLTLLRRDIRWFAVFYWLFYPVSFPLIALTKLFQRFARGETRPVDLVLGRTRLVHVLQEGHREGLLTDLQSRLINGLMQTAGQPVREAMTPANRILGLADTAGADAILEHARRYGLTSVPLHREGRPREWYGYVRVADVRISRQPVSALIQQMPRIDVSAGKLAALLILREAGQVFGRVMADDEVLGIVHERGLIEQMLRRPAESVSGALPRSSY